MTKTNDRIVSVLRNVIASIDMADAIIADCCQPFSEKDKPTTGELTACAMQGLLARAKEPVMAALGHRIHEIEGGHNHG